MTRLGAFNAGETPALPATAKPISLKTITPYTVRARQVDRYRFYLKNIVAFTLVGIAITWAIRLDDAGVAIKEIAGTENIASRLNSDTTNNEAPLVEFKDETFVKGILHKHTQKKDHITSFEDTLGGGVCVADFNNDGWDDVFFITGSGNLRHFGKNIWWENPTPNQLYINQQGQYFINATTEYGINEAGFGMACAVADLDKDGFVDLVVANKGENFIYHNLGGTTFAQVKTAFKKNQELFSTSILIHDFNQDGQEDILFGNYVSFTQDQNILELHSGFDTQKNNNFDPALYDPQPDTLFINKGGLRFDFSENHTLPNRHGRTLSFFKHQSIIALNDKGSPSQLISPDRRQGTKQQTDRLDEIVLNARDAKIINTPTNPSQKLFVASDALKGGLYAINMNGAPNDMSWEYTINKVDRLFSTWALLQGDFNRDGFDDMFLSNGLALPHPDTNQTPTGQPNILLIAAPQKGNFSTESLLNERVLSSRGAATLDMNNDGKLDIVVNNNNDYASLLINSTKTNSKWLGLRCYPAYSCALATLTINGKHYTDAFKPKISFTSESTNAFLLKLDDNINQAEITLTTPNKLLHANISELSTYYTIKLVEQSIEPLQQAPIIAANHTATEREELIALIRKNIITPRLTELTNNWANTTAAHQLIILPEIIAAKNKTGLPLAERWALSNDSSVASKSIEALRILEAEEGVPRLIGLLNSNNTTISCAAAKAFEYFYWKDEAVIERKKWAQTELIKLISDSNADVKKTICALDALAESEAYRALEPLLRALKSPNDKIAAHAARALGMLRQTGGASALTQQLTSSPSPMVRAEALVALVRLKADISAVTPDKILKKNDINFNTLFEEYLKKSADGVNTGFIGKKLFNNNKSTHHYYNYLSSDELFDLHALFNTYKLNPDTHKKIADTLTFSDKSITRTPSPTIKTDIGDTRLLALTSVITTRSQTEVRRNAKSVICSNLHFDLEPISSVKDAFAPPNANIMAGNLRSCLNSGFYTESKILAQFYSQLDSYWLAIIQLINSPLVQNQEVLYIARNYPIHAQSLAGITARIQRSPVEEQLELLRALEQQIPADTFKQWLGTWQVIDNSTIQHFISGRLQS